MEIASAFVSIMPSMRGFGSKVTSEVDGVGKKSGLSFGKLFAAGAAIGVGAKVFDFLGDSLGEAREAQKVGALTANAIKATGGAANISAAQVGKLSSALSLKTGMDDEAIQSGANLLLTFKNVANEAGKGNDVFNRATAAAADLSAAGFGALTGTSKQLGKALNDPVKGISALGRAGVTFTEQQQEQIKALVESGDTLKAQKIILGEVESQVGGAAAASATYGEKAAVAFGNVKEQVGTALLPVVDGFFKMFLSAVPTVTNLIGGIGPAFSKVGTFLAPLVGQIKSAFSSGGAGGGLLAFATSIQSTVLPVLKTVATTFMTVILPAVTRVVSYVASALMPVFSQVAGIITGKVLPILSSLAQFFYGKVIPAVVKVAQSVGAKLKPIFDQLVATFQSKVLPTIAKLLDKFREWQPTIQKVILVVVKVVGKVLEFAAAILGKVLPVAIRFAGFLISKIVPAVAAVIGVIIKIIGKVVDFGVALVDGVQAAGKFLSGLKDKMGAAVAFLADIPNKIVGVFKGAGTLLLSIGGQIVDGLKAGIEGAWGKVTAVVDSLIGKIPKRIREIMGIASPSKVTTKIGEQIMDGLTMGFGKGGKKMRERLTAHVDKIKETFTTLKSDMASLAQSVANAFNPDMFGLGGKDAVTEEVNGIVKVLEPATTALQEFMGGLSGNNSNLTAMLAAFDQLKEAGASKGFLSGLLQSGNTALATQLATTGPAAVKAASALFDENAILADQLGNKVAVGEYGEEIRNEMKALNKAMDDAPKKYAKELKGVLNGLELVVSGTDAGQKAYMRTGRR